MNKYLNRLFSLILILIISVMLTGCKIIKMIFTTETVSYTNSIELSCDEDIEKYLPYTDFPKYTLEFEGTLNIAKVRQGNFECVFTNNDDFVVSRLIKNLIAKYQEMDPDRVMTVLLNTEEETETWMNYRDEETDEKVFLKVKDAKIYNEITYILLENGLILSCNYARFVDSDNVTYYRWQKTESIRLVLHYPFMITNDTSKVPNQCNNDKSFVFFGLPLGVTLSFDTTTKRLEKLLEDDKFMESTYYSYEYINSSEEDIPKFKNFYEKFYNGKTIDNEFIFTYLEYDFKIDFNEDYFIISLK